MSGSHCAAGESLLTELVSVLRQCAVRFREYERSHLSKGTEEGRLKALRNADIAKVVEDIVGRATAGSSQ